MPSDALETQRIAVQKTLTGLNIRPRRRAGQHFLLDRQVVDDLLAGADVRSADVVLEIGPGLGVVTEALARRASRVVAVELDRTLAAWLSERFGSRPQVQVVPADIVRLRLSDYVQDGRFKIVASLPFNVTSLVLRNFLERAPRPTVISLLIQKEVAERAVAPPGSMSLLSASVQYLGRPAVVRTVPKELFWPQPEVDGAVIRIEVKPLPPADVRKNFFRLVRIGFSARRKMLHRNLAAGLQLEPAAIKSKLRAAGLDEHCRAQEVGVEQWLKLGKILL
ncbi:MAG: ribosomal RNA small subunit methyltransferase A [Candidatus Kerfeldbacteria bacterium]|nr:ribosomal RNA small subunit methyltransferase A [Candidatus Kerfeldbacteria bacterium]